MYDMLVKNNKVNYNFSKATDTKMDEHWTYSEYVVEICHVWANHVHIPAYLDFTCIFQSKNYSAYDEAKIK